MDQEEGVKSLSEVQRLLSEAEGELQRCRTESDSTKEMVKAAREEMEYFVYAASHDLQQPLRAITAYAQLLQRDGASDERAKEFIGFIVEGATQMSSLLRDLLTYSRTGNACSTEELKLEGPLQWSLYTLAKPIADCGATVTTSPMPTVQADEKQMVTLFEQLIGNALKFRSKQPPVVNISSGTVDESHVITVRDNGIGVPPEYQEVIFKPFKRLHGKEFPGSGLGLALCKKIMRAHGGHLWLQSDGQNGSAFSFSLPM